MRSRWWHQPLLHTARLGFHKKASWLELFYDLMFVAAMIQVGNGLSSSVSGNGVLAFAGVFTCLWVSWIGFTYYANRYTVDDFAQRLLVFVQMFAVALMTLSVGEALNPEKSYRFALAYGMAQFAVFVMYLRSYSMQPLGRKYALYWGSVFGAAGLLWIFSVFIPHPYHYVFWGLGVAMVFIAPFHRRSLDLAQVYPVDHEHLSERFALLTLIVLGESFVKALSHLATLDLSAGTLVYAFGLLTLVGSIWWIYFDDVAGTHLRHSRLAGMFWLFSHLPLQMAIVATAIGLKKALDFDLTQPAPTAYLTLLCTSIAVILFSVAAIDSVTERKNTELSDRARIQFRLWCGAILLLLGPLASSMEAAWSLGLILLIIASQVIFDLLAAPRADVEHFEKYIAQTEDVAEDIETEEGPPQYQPGSAIRKGVPSEFKKDVYFFLMESSWPKVFMVLSVVFVLLNSLFALIYLLDPTGIGGVRPGQFIDAFFFSVQTMATIGYGVMHPVSRFAHTVVTIQAAFSLICVAVVTGFMFAKVSRPRSGILFSKVGVITKVDGHLMLIFRVGNTKGNDIIDASVRVTALIDHRSQEGHHQRRMLDLELVRDRSAFFALSWTVMHRLDERSPIWNASEGKFNDSVLALSVVLLGFDGTYSQSVYKRHAYFPRDFSPDRQLEDVISTLPDGTMVLDFTKFHLLKT